MNIDFESLLKPITEESPCGRDISDETDFYMLEETAKGKQETQFSEGEPPNWNEVLDLALTLFNQSKDLWVAYYILCSMVNLYGDEGMVKGVEFLQALLEKFWDSLTPKLDTDSDMPSFQRINIVRDVFVLQGPFVTGVKDIILTKSGIGSFSYKDILASGKEDQLVTENVILAAISDSDKEFLTRLKSNFKKTQELAKTLKMFLQDKGISTEFEEAFTAFVSMLNTIEKYLDSNNNATEDEQNQQPESSNVSGKTSKNKVIPVGKKVTTDQISNYQDIIRMLKKICKWYEENEPSSPVPLFLNKAESLIGKNFVDIVNDVASSAMKDISVLFKMENKQEAGKSK
jgi:type VI secretion system protein ImpA